MRTSRTGLLLQLLVVTLALHCALSRGQATSSAIYDASGNLASIGPSLGGGPVIVGQPRSRVGPLGGSVSLSVFAAGAQPLSYQWQLEGVNIPGATSDTLLLSGLTSAQFGNYRVIVSNALGSAPSSNAMVQPDADGDGLGDWWEVANFGSITNQNAAMDFDGDGTSNLVEFQDGTSPTNRLSLLPRLAVRAFGGRVTVSPDVEAYTPGVVATLTAIPDPGLTFIGWSGALTGTANPATLTMTANQQVMATFGLPLAPALNTTNPVITGGAGGWYGQAGVTIDGQAVAAAPPLAGSGPPFLETTIVMQREGTLSFKWKVEGEDYSSLVLSVNGNQPFRTWGISGLTAWQSKTIYLPAGSNRVRWTYYRNGGGWKETSALTKPRDSAYLDQLVVAEYLDPQLDTDGNGLPDLWEYRYFDSLGNDPNADPDFDGVANRLELADGTAPNEKPSVKPRLAYVIEGEGTATASPALALYSYGQYVTNTAAAAAGWQFVGWIGPFDNNYFDPRIVTNRSFVDRLYTAKTYRAIFGTPPGTAADQPTLTWTTSPSRSWYGQALVTHDGTNAAQSALTVDSMADTESWLETSVTGPGTLSFFWKTSSAADRDYLALLINSTEAAPRLSGITDWQPVVLALPAGQQTLRWLFKRYYGYDTNALNTAWLDQVQYVPGPSKPVFIDLPAGLQGFETKDLSFRAAARGTPPVTYQVLRNGVALSQPSTNQVITVPSVTAAMAGNWVVRAANAFGTTDSSTIPVSILPLPPNDSFANAKVLSGPPGVFNGYSIGATAEPNEPSHDGYSPRASVWHRWTAPANGGIHFTAVSTNPPSNLILAVYQGTSLASLTDVAADNQYATMTNGIELARVDLQFQAVAGRTYSLAVDAGDEGAFYQLSLAAVPPPVNDNFANRLPLTGSPVTVSGDNTMATAEPGEPPVYSLPPFFVINASNTLWWSWTAPATGKLSINAEPDEYSALVSVFTGSSLNALTRLTDPFAPTKAINVAMGAVYAISAGSMDGGVGHFTFQLAMDAAVPTALTVALVAPEGIETGQLELHGPPQAPVRVQFSPNLKDWYPWSTNNLSVDGSLKVSIQQQPFPDDTENGPPPPIRKRFFRAVSP